MKVNSVVKKETISLAIGIVVCIIITQLGFLIFGMYGLPILLGATYGGAVSLLNFFLMGLTVQKVTNVEDQNTAKKQMQFSYSVRQLGLLLLVGLGMYISSNFGIFHWLPILIAMLYPRIIIMVIGMYRKNKGNGEG